LSGKPVLEGNWVFCCSVLSDSQRHQSGKDAMQDRDLVTDAARIDCAPASTVRPTIAAARVHGAV